VNPGFASNRFSTAVAASAVYFSRGSHSPAGSQYGLWYMHHVYELTPQSKAKRFAAEKVRVKGWMENDVLHIESIAPVPVAASAH
jgi:hypothetical protein